MITTNNEPPIYNTDECDSCHRQFSLDELHDFRGEVVCLTCIEHEADTHPCAIRMAINAGEPFTSVIDIQCVVCDDTMPLLEEMPHDDVNNLGL